MLKACHVGIAVLGFVLALASRGEADGPAVGFGSTVAGAAELACLADVNAEWSRGEVVCGGTGIPGISFVDIFLHDDFSQTPFLRWPVTDPFGSPWSIPLTSIPAPPVGHAFERGDLAIGFVGVSGQSAGIVDLVESGLARVRSVIPGTDGSPDAEVEAIFPVYADGFEARDTSTWCAEVNIPNDGRSVSDVKVVLGKDGPSMAFDVFEATNLAPSKRGAFECVEGSTVFNPRDPAATVFTEITLGGLSLAGTRAPCTAVERILDLNGTDLPNTLCLNDHRFEVKVEWEDFQGLGAPAIAAPLTDEEGIFVFVNPEDSVPNKLLVNVANGCGVNGAYWVFAGGAANGGFTLTVRDTVSGQSVSWANPDGLRFPLIMDTSLFSTCP